MTAADGAREHACDLCGSDDAVEVPHAREYTGGQPIHICRGCGFVYVRRRRTADEIAASWSDEIFGGDYTAAIPAVTARLTYVAETVAREVGLEGKRVCEIGAGEGEFLKLARDRGATVFGIEPSAANCRLLEEAGIDCFNGTIEQFDGDARFDVVAILWTLENCERCRVMLERARSLLADGGHVVVATGSRILVPFKKPLHMYLSTRPADTNAFRFSANTLRGALAVAGLEQVYVNRYLDSDILCAIARAAGGDVRWDRDDYLEVWGFFARWHADTALHWPEERA